MLAFIDTNIYLDFYRYSNDVSLSLLRRLNTNHHRIITTTQVEMEYKKNRQKVILGALASINPHDSAQLNIPSFLKESKHKKTAERLADKRKRLATRLVIRTEKLLESPGVYDPVYKILQRLFKARSDCHLTRDKEVRTQIRESANKRYTLGYPPRKPSDTSIGDAVNWEWILYCANQQHDDVVIISRDTDYGQHHKDNSYLNDWLLQEFKERVGRRRSIFFTKRLAEGFKLAGIDVAEEEEKAEEFLIEKYWTVDDLFTSMSVTTQPLDDTLKRLSNSVSALSYGKHFSEMLAKLTKISPSLHPDDFRDTDELDQSEDEGTRLS